MMFFFLSICFCWCAIAVVSYAHHCTFIISPSLFIFTGTYQTVQDKMASFLTDTFTVRSASKKSREMRWNCQMTLLSQSRKFYGHYTSSYSLVDELTWFIVSIFFPSEKFQRASFPKWKMISLIMNLLWNVMNVAGKCTKFVSYTLNLFGQMGKWDIL